MGRKKKQTTKTTVEEFLEKQKAQFHWMNEDEEKPKYEDMRLIPIIKVRQSERMSSKKIIPELHAERCPVCTGYGTVGFEPDIKICPACDGKCIVFVPNFMN